MTTKCMLTALLLTCCVVLIIIILITLNNNKNETRYFASDNFVDNPVKIENERLMFNNNHISILNLETFQYIIDTKCNYSSEDFEVLEDDNKSTKILWIITSYAGDVLKRSTIRHAYKAEELKQLGIKRIFLLGTLNEKAQKDIGVTQPAIEDEAQRFQDIVQGNFLEAYKNLTYKHLMGLQWAIDKCSQNYSYIMKMDDDIIVNLYEAVALLQNKSKTNINEDFLMGYVLEHMTPIRNKANKWYIANEEFSKKIYPTFLSGWFYITDMLTALKLIYQSKRHKNYFWIDDLFITGILREEAGIKNFINIKEFFTSDYRFLECCLKNEENSPIYKCDFIVGPDGGNSNLLLNFQKFSKNCYGKKCIPRPKEKLLKNTCILDYQNFNIGVGSVKVEKIVSNLIV